MAQDRFSDTCGPMGPIAETANFAFMTLEEEALAHGWTRQNMPTGKTPPPPAPVVGMRGESGIDSDPSYGNPNSPGSVTERD